MIESVSTSYVQGATLRGNPQAESAYAVSGNVSAAVSDDLPRYGARLFVRLDSGAQRAILEVRSSETGEVVRQYPSEAQMRAFQRAAALKEGQDEARSQAAAEQQMRQDMVAQSSGQSQPATPQPSMVQVSPMQVVQASATVAQAAPEPMPASAGEGVLV